MKKKAETKRRSGCPINVALEIFGDRWSLLIVRDLMFTDRRTYKEFLAAEEGIATNILTDRLQWLETKGLITWEQDQADGRRSLYRLTSKGIDLAPIMVEMILWGARHEETAAPPALIRKMKKDPAGFAAEILLEGTLVFGTGAAGFC